MIDIKTQLSILSLLIILIVFIGYSGAFANDVPTCNGYLSNVYLYILLAFAIFSFSILFIAKQRFPVTSTKSLVAFGVAVILLFSLYSIRPEQIVLNHSVWILFIIALSVSVYTSWKYSSYSPIFVSTFLTTFVIAAGLTMIVSLNPDLVTLSAGPILMVALGCIIIGSLLPVIFRFQSSTYNRVISILAAIVFCILIMYDTQLLKEKAALCVFPDYPKDSLGLFLDGLNLASILNS